jgi:hypothetical protein
VFDIGLKIFNLFLELNVHFVVKDHK